MRREGLEAKAGYLPSRREAAGRRDHDLICGMRRGENAS